MKLAKKDRLRLGAGIAALAVVGLILWLTLDGGDSESDSPATAEIVTIEDLRDEAAAQEAPIYWAGAQEGAELELSRPDSTRTYVRYLTGGAEAGDPRPDFLTVGTYEIPDAVATLQRQGRQSDGVLAKAPGGATVFFNRERPSSVYLAYPGVDVQIEIYDPDFRQALQLVNSGQIVPAG